MESTLNFKNRAIYKANFSEGHCYLNKKAIVAWAENLFDWLFCLKETYVNYTCFNDKENELKDELENFLLQEKFTETAAADISASFFGKIGDAHLLLLDDLGGFVNADPAARSKYEVLIAYPGFFALALYRISHELWRRGALLIARLICEYAHTKTGIDIHPAAEIGERFFIDHGTGIVIGETAKIGNDVKIYQGVTLGALSVSKEKAEMKRHPTIGNNVVLYANATILGGDTLIGENSVIGGNVWLTRSVPPGTKVFHKNEIITEPKEVRPKPVQFNI